MLIALPLGKMPAVKDMKDLIIVEGASAQLPEAHHQGDKSEQYIEGDLPAKAGAQTTSL